MLIDFHWDFDKFLMIVVVVDSFDHKPEQQHHSNNSEYYYFVVLDLKIFDRFYRYSVEDIQDDLLIVP